jgi:hypothetical protein
LVTARSIGFAKDNTSGFQFSDGTTVAQSVPNSGSLNSWEKAATFSGKGGCVMSISIERELQRRFRSLTAIGRDWFLLGRSQSRMALFFVLTCLILISSISQAATPAIDLKDAVDEFVRSIPGSKQGGYKNPMDDLTARTRLVEGFKKARDGDLSAATEQLALVNYKASLYVDSGTGREVVILQEQKDKGAYPRAWGLYVIAWPPKQNSSNLVVEVPHACPPNMPNKPKVCDGGDTNSHLVGVEAFRSANARYLFINGAQRNATSLSDVAHQPKSAFQKIHEAALDPKQMGLGSSAKVYQAHRFFTDNHDGKNAPRDNMKPGTGRVANVVVSNATKTPAGTLAEKVAVAVEAKDSSFFFVCLATGGGTCSNLAATTNVQKDRMFGGSFVHVEANEFVYACSSPCRRDQLAQAVADAMK